MTATIKPPEERPGPGHGLRFSSMEILGFADTVSIWSESSIASPPEAPRRGRHEATVADHRPEELGGQLSRSNVRWGLVTLIVVLAAGLAGLAYWLYQRPIAQETAAISAMATQASELDSTLGTLETANDGLLTGNPVEQTSDLSALEANARSLFETSGTLNSSETEVRTAASEAAGSALDGIRLVRGARSYRAAVLPMLGTPELETDPQLIELDEAARQFGDWQLNFETTRSALPDSVLADVTFELDILTSDLPSVLSSYLDSLREDDMAAADNVLADLGLRLADIENSLESSLGRVHDRVGGHLDEARQALARIHGG